MFSSINKPEGAETSKASGSGCRTLLYDQRLVGLGMAKMVLGYCEQAQRKQTDKTT